MITKAGTILANTFITTINIIIASQDYKRKKKHVKSISHTNNGIFQDNPVLITLLEQSICVSQLLSQSHCPLMTLQDPCELQSTSPVQTNAMKINQLSTQKQFK